MKSSNYCKRLLLALLLTLALLVTFVACDGSSGGEESSDGAPDETTGTVDPDETTGGGDGSGDEDGDETTGNAGGSETGGSSSGGSETSGNAGSTETSGSPSGGSETSGSSGGSQDDPSAPGIEAVTYTVTVVDGTGNPLKNIIVKLSSGKQAATNSSGVATLTVARGSYTFTLEKIGGGEYLYDASACVLSPGAPSVTISFVEKVSTETTPGTGNSGSSGGEGSEGGDEPTIDKTKGDIIWADPDGDGTLAEYYAPYVSAGSVAVTLNANDMTYVLFYPQVAGQYRISATSATATVSVGNYGNPFFVQTNNIAETAGVSYFEMNVRAGSIRTLDTGTLIVVVGLKTTDGSAGDAILTIERFADPLTDSADVPFEEIVPESKYLASTPSVSGTLTDVDITKADVTIVKGSDGYYHFGSESGPIVMLRLSTASPYIDSFVKIGDCQSLAYYEYDAHGNLLKKQRWNDVVTAFAAYANGDGVVPLNDQLIEMLQDVGTHMGWWEEGHPQYLFEEIDEVTKNAYLFACCYYA